MPLLRLIAPLTLAILAIGADAVQAQSPSPAPLPGQGPAGAASAPASPPVNRGALAATLGAPFTSPFPSRATVTDGIAAPSPNQAEPYSPDCMKELQPLRDEADLRAKLIRGAGARHATPDEVCPLIKNFAQAEIKMINYVETHATTCGIPSHVPNELKTAHNNTEAMMTRVCTLAQQMQQRGPAGPSGDFPPYYGLTPR